MKQEETGISSIKELFSKEGREKRAEKRKAADEIKRKKRNEKLDEKMGTTYANLLNKKVEDVRSVWRDPGSSYDSMSPARQLTAYADAFPSNFGVMDAEAKEKILRSRSELVQDRADELKEDGVTEIKPFIRILYREQLAHTNNLKRQINVRGGDFAYSENPHIESSRQEVRNVLDRSDLTVKLDTAVLKESLKQVKNDGEVVPDPNFLSVGDLTKEQLEDIKEYLKINRELSHLSAQILSSSGIEGKTKELEKELERLHEELTDSVIKIGPWTEEEKNKLDLLKMGIESEGAEEDENSPYAWERENAYFYDMVRFRDDASGVPIMVLYYVTEGSPGEPRKLNWEIVNENGEAVNLENNKVSVNIPEDINSDDDLKQLIDNVVEKKSSEGGYSYDKEREEPGNQNSRLVRAEVPLPDVRMREIDGLETEESENPIFKKREDLVRKTGELSIKSDLQIFSNSSAVQM